MGNRDFTAAEFARAARTEISFYREIVRRSSGFGFYTQAPAAAHHVITPKGENKYLQTIAEISKFYGSLRENEQKHLQDNNQDIGKLLADNNEFSDK